MPGNGTAALTGANDTVTQRYQQAVDAGLNMFRFFASEGTGGALLTAPGAQAWLIRIIESSIACST